MPITTKNSRPFLFKKGTRVTDTLLNFDVSSWDRTKGATMWMGAELGHQISAAVNNFLAEHGEKPLAQDTLITITFTSFQAVIEVSDQQAEAQSANMVHEGPTRSVDA